MKTTATSIFYIFTFDNIGATKYILQFLILRDRFNPNGGLCINLIQEQRMIGPDVRLCVNRRRKVKLRIIRNPVNVAIS